jgi:hypothetical protein
MVKICHLSCRPLRAVVNEMKNEVRIRCDLKKEQVKASWRIENRQWRRKREKVQLKASVVLHCMHTDVYVLFGLQLKRKLYVFVCLKLFKIRFYVRIIENLTQTSWFSENQVAKKVSTSIDFLYSVAFHSCFLLEDFVPLPLHSAPQYAPPPRHNEGGRETRAACNQWVGGKGLWGRTIGVEISGWRSSRAPSRSVRVHNFVRFSPKISDFHSYRSPPVNTHTGNFNSILFSFFKS